MQEVTIDQILLSREQRVLKQKSLLKQFGQPVICFTMNIAGPVKTSPLIVRAFQEGIHLLKEKLTDENILAQDISTALTGCEALFSVNLAAKKLKQICMEIEEASPLGRLFDMDVIDTSEKKLEREKLRGCIVCGAPGRECAAGRLHPVNAIQDTTKKIMEDYFFEKDTEYFSALAVKCLLDEVYTTPKPGLVDLNNNGSHRDMDVKTFESSAKALKPYFAKCFTIGKETADMPQKKVFEVLKDAGIRAEQLMYAATGGINTHKGAIYSMGILIAAVGRLWSPENKKANIEDVCRECSKMVLPTIKEELEKTGNSTAGGRLYTKHGFTGIRGEAASGFSSVLDTGLPCYKRLIKKGLDLNHAGAITLLYLICRVKDTNLYHRGGIEGAEMAIDEVKKLLKDFPEPEISMIATLDDLFIKNNLSPGGCADLIAVTYFLYNLEL